MNFHSINHKMWLGRNGTIHKAIDEYGDATALIAIYLFSSPHSNQAGVFSCPIHYIATETRRTPDEVEQCLKNLGELGFCKYDYESEVVWVINLVRYQVSSWPSDKGDKRYKGVLNVLRSLPESYLVADFCDMWGLEHPSTPAGGDNSTVQYSGHPSKGLTRGLQGASIEADENTVNGHLSVGGIQ